MIRWISLAAGVCLIAVAFIAVTHVENTRNGLIAEVVTEFAALVGISLTLYGLLAGSIRRGARSRAANAARDPSPASRVRSVRDLVAGVAGLVTALGLLTGIALSAGIQWSLLGGVVLLPMIAGSVYLCSRFMVAPARSWRLEIKKPGSERRA